MALNVENFEFGGELKPNTIFAFRITSVRSTLTKAKDKLRLNVAATVAAGPCQGQTVFFAGYDFIVYDFKKKQPNLFRLFNDISKLTGVPVAELKKFPIPTAEDEVTNLMRTLLNTTFEAKVVWNEGQGEYEGQGSWQLAMKNVVGHIEAESLQMPDWGEMFSND